MIKAVVFDCFGVLITDALEMLRAELVNEQPEQARQIEDIITASNRGFMAPKEAMGQLADLSGRSLAVVHEAMDQDEVKDGDLLGYILSLRATHKTAMLSNISSQGLRDRFTPAELDRYFDAAVASGDIGYAKPEPEAYETVASRLGVRMEDCLMVDDRQVCVDGAHAVGMQSILYTSFDAFRTELTGIIGKGG